MRLEKVVNYDESKLLSSSNLKGILGYTNEDLVSTYFLRKSRL
ncbi:putative glyceraldehyde-3-phosphate dehydrogenase (phosphorylating) [Helianthus debilis subsp. tardiflorus]